jgi:cytidylate kinase
MSDKPGIITINHQVGSGAAYVGQKLSERLGIPFVDRQILKQVAARLKVAEAELEDREQRLQTFWQSFSRTAEYMTDLHLVSDKYVPSDRDLFESEAEAIRSIAEKSPAIFLGRCGGYVLRQHPRHFCLLLMADLPARIKRMGELYGLLPEAASQALATNDRERTAYIQTFTRENWLDVRLYDMCVNTTRVGLDQTVELVLACLASLPQPLP